MTYYTRHVVQKYLKCAKLTVKVKPPLKIVTKKDKGLKLMKIELVMHDPYAPFII